jgi:host factor-I protein
MNKKESVQDTFLLQLKKQKARVNIFLANGIKLEGTIEAFDQYVVLLRNSNVCMLYKNNIATVAPASTFNLKRTSDEETDTTSTTKD